MAVGKILKTSATAAYVDKELHRTKEELFEGLGDSIYRTVLRGMLGNDVARDFGGVGFQQSKSHTDKSVLQKAGQAYNLFKNVQSYQQYGQSQQSMPGTSGPGYGPIP